MSINRWRIIAWAEKETIRSVKYGPRALYGEVFQINGTIRLVVVPPTPPRAMPNSRYLS